MKTCSGDIYRPFFSDVMVPLKPCALTKNVSSHEMVDHPDVLNRSNFSWLRQRQSVNQLLDICDSPKAPHFQKTQHRINNLFSES
jgi:hypothetical protein